MIGENISIKPSFPNCNTQGADSFERRFTSLHLSCVRCHMPRGLSHLVFCIFLKFLSHCYNENNCPLFMYLNVILFNLYAFIFFHVLLWEFMSLYVLVFTDPMQPGLLYKHNFVSSSLTESMILSFRIFKTLSIPNRKSWRGDIFREFIRRFTYILCLTYIWGSV